MTSTRLLAARIKIKTLVRANQIAVVVVFELASFSDPQNEEPAEIRRELGRICKKIGESSMDCCQLRLRVIHMKKMKAMTNPVAISIQYWPSKPIKAKRLMRNCTVSVPASGQNKRFVWAR